MLEASETAMSSDSKQDDREITIYRGHIVSSINEDSYLDIRDGALAVSQSGKILAVGKWADLSKQFTASQGAGVVSIVDCGKRLILPGLIDLHIHLPQVTQIGKSGDTLLGWLEKYIFPAESRFNDDDHARKIARWFFDELACNGTTLAVVFTTIHKNATEIAFQVAAEKGSRAIMGKVMMDRLAPDSLTEDTTTSVDESKALARKWHGYDDGRLLYAFTPRFAITATDKLLEACGKAWKEHPGTYMHTHLSESLEEIKKVAELFPSAKSYLDVYDRNGLVQNRSIFAHSIHLEDADLKTMGKAKCALAHCPSSNFFLKSGVFPVERIKNAGIEFGLGSDVAGGPQMSLFGVMKDANFIQPNIWITPCELLFRATRGGARALHLEEKLGSLEAGKEADFIIVDPSAKTAAPSDILDQGTDEILSALVFLGDDRMIDATYVKGRPIFVRDQQKYSKETFALHV